MRDTTRKEETNKSHFSLNSQNKHSVWLDGLIRDFLQPNYEGNERVLLKKPPLILGPGRVVLLQGQYRLHNLQPQLDTLATTFSH